MSTENSTDAMSSVTVVTVTLQDREGGGLEVFSDDLPGLILSGPDRDKVAAAIIPAIEALFKYRGFERVRVRATTPVSQVLQSASPRDVDIHIQHEQFVVELPEAA
jgi:TctA family transporter